MKGVASSAGCALHFCVQIWSNCPLAEAKRPRQPHMYCGHINQHKQFNDSGSLAGTSISDRRAWKRAQLMPSRPRADQECVRPKAKLLDMGGWCRLCRPWSRPDCERLVVPFARHLPFPRGRRGHGSIHAGCGLCFCIIFHSNSRNIAAKSQGLRRLLHCGITLVNIKGRSSPPEQGF